MTDVTRYLELEMPSQNTTFSLLSSAARRLQSTFRSCMMCKMVNSGTQHYARCDSAQKLSFFNWEATPPSPPPPPPVSGPGYLGRDVLVLECSRIVDCSGFCSQALCYALNHLRQRKCTAMRILLYRYRTYKYCRRLTVGSLRGPTFYIKTDTYFLKS